MRSSENLAIILISQFNGESDRAQCTFCIFKSPPSIHSSRSFSPFAEHQNSLRMQAGFSYLEGCFTLLTFAVLLGSFCGRNWKPEWFFTNRPH